MNENKLTKGEAQAPLWLKIEKILKARLESLRIKNDASMTESETAKLRGRITEVKFLLDLPLADPVSTTDPDY